MAVTFPEIRIGSPIRHEGLAVLAYRSARAVAGGQAPVLGFGDAGVHEGLNRIETPRRKDTLSGDLATLYRAGRNARFGDFCPSGQPSRSSQQRLEPLRERGVRERQLAVFEDGNLSEWRAQVAVVKYQDMGQLANSGGEV